MRPARRVRRGLLLAGLLGGLLSPAACNGGGTAPATGPAASTNAGGPTAPASGPAAGTGTGAPVGAAGDPCALLTPDDLRTVLQEQVTATTRRAPVNNGRGTGQTCVFSTDGPRLSDKVFAASSQILRGLVGESLDAPATAVLGIWRLHLTNPAPAGASLLDGAPAGTKTLAGVGVPATILADDYGTFGYALADPTDVVSIFDLEARSLTNDQMARLLAAAVSRA